MEKQIYKPIYQQQVYIFDHKASVHHSISYIEFSITVYRQQ